MSPHALVHPLLRGMKDVVTPEVNKDEAMNANQKSEGDREQD
jgi:hypothetical protein